MRTIKFRAWDKQNKVMRFIKNLWIDFAKLGQEHIDKNLNLHVLDLMQFTGLKDKNGKEIYEGDIVRDKWEEIKEEQYIDYEIRWDIEEARFYGYNVDKFANGLEVNELIDVEVIGNIHKNKELIQKVEAKPR